MKSWSLLVLSHSTWKKYAHIYSQKIGRMQRNAPANVIMWLFLHRVMTHMSSTLTAASFYARVHVIVNGLTSRHSAPLLPWNIGGCRLSSHPSNVMSHPSNVMSHPSNVMSHHSNVMSHPSNIMSHHNNVMSNRMSCHHSNVMSHPSNVMSHPSNVMSHHSNVMSNRMSCLITVMSCLIIAMSCQIACHVILAMSCLILAMSYKSHDMSSQQCHVKSHVINHSMLAWFGAPL